MGTASDFMDFLFSLFLLRSNTIPPTQLDSLAIHLNTDSLLAVSGKLLLLIKLAMPLATIFVPLCGSRRVGIALSREDSLWYT
jgi:hypothetical protein